MMLSTRRRSNNVRAAGPPTVLFLGVAYAGNRTRFLNLQENTKDDPRIHPRYRQVRGWVDGGAIERLPFLPASAKGRARAVGDAAAVAHIPRPDVIWSAAAETISPYMWSQTGRLRRPLVLDLDCTFDQLEDLAPAYFQRPPRTGVRRALARLQHRLVWRYTSLFTPWSTWAADALRQAGIKDDRIHVLPPGIDLEQWRPRPELRPQDSGPLRLLFVGADFNRKGGPVLVDVVQNRFADRCVLDVVTQSSVPTLPGVRIHRAEPNSQILRELYAQADLFVLPTRAECFGIVAIEAMASGLPVIMSDIGAARDIVEHGHTGWLIDPTAQALTYTLQHALENRERLSHMGGYARSVATARFDGKKNDRLLVDLLLDQHEKWHGRGYSCLAVHGYASPGSVQDYP